MGVLCALELVANVVTTKGDKCWKADLIAYCTFEYTGLMWLAHALLHADVGKASVYEMRILKLLCANYKLTVTYMVSGRERYSPLAVVAQHMCHAGLFTSGAVVLLCRLPGLGIQLPVGKVEGLLVAVVVT